MKIELNSQGKVKQNGHISSSYTALEHQKKIPCVPVSKFCTRAQGQVRLRLLMLVRKNTFLRYEYGCFSAA